MSRPLKLKALCHLGFTVIDIDEWFTQWGDNLGCTERHVHRETATGGILVNGIDHGFTDVSVAFTRMGGLPVELIQTHGGRTTHLDWLEQHGPGLHHVAFWVDDIDAEVRAATELGMQILMAPKGLGRAVVSTDVSVPDSTNLTIPNIFAFLGLPTANEPWTLELLDVGLIDEYRRLNGDLPGYPENA